MEIIKKILKLPLLIGSILLILAFGIGLTVISLRPYTEGVYKYSSRGISIEVEVDDDEIIMTTISTSGVKKVNKYDALIKKGKLFIKTSPSATEYVELGDINSFKITSDEFIDNEVISLKCGLANTLRTVNIVMICVGVVGLATSIVFIMLNKNNSSTDEKTEKAA